MWMVPNRSPQELKVKPTISERANSRHHSAILINFISPNSRQQPLQLDYVAASRYYCITSASILKTQQKRSFQQLSCWLIQLTCSQLKSDFRWKSINSSLEMSRAAWYGMEQGPTPHKTGHFRDVLPSQSLGSLLTKNQTQQNWQHLNSFHFIWAPDYVLFLSSALHCFYPKLPFIVCCTAFSTDPFLDTHHSWRHIARNRVGTVIGRWMYKCVH